jgi:hypothetical protein
LTFCSKAIVLSFLSFCYFFLQKNEIPKEGFTRHMKDIVGDQMLRMAVSKLQQVLPFCIYCAMLWLKPDNQPRVLVCKWNHVGIVCLKVLLASALHFYSFFYICSLNLAGSKDYCFLLAWMHIEWSDMK